MPLPVQCAVMFRIADKQVFGTVWAVETPYLLVTTRANIPPSSHARMQLELPINDEHDPFAATTVRGQVIVRNANSGSFQGGPNRYSVEIREMDYEDGLKFAQWAEKRQQESNTDPEQPTDVLLIGSRPVEPPEKDELPTEQSMVKPRIHTEAAVPRRRPTLPATPRVATRRIRTSDAEARFEPPGRIWLTWTRQSDFDADWHTGMSNGTLYLRCEGPKEGRRLTLLAALPNGARALFSATVTAARPGLVVLSVTMGQETRRLFSAAAERADFPRS